MNEAHFCEKVLAIKKSSKEKKILTFLWKIYFDKSACKIVYLCVNIYIYKKLAIPNIKYIYFSPIIILCHKNELHSSFLYIFIQSMFTMFYTKNLYLCNSNIFSKTKYPVAIHIKPMKIDIRIISMLKIKVQNKQNN